MQPTWHALVECAATGCASECGEDKFLSILILSIESVRGSTVSAFRCRWLLVVVHGRRPDSHLAAFFWWIALFAFSASTTAFTASGLTLAPAAAAATRN